MSKITTIGKRNPNLPFHPGVRAGDFIFISGQVAKDEAALKALTPRLRDAVLGYLRRLTYEELSDPAASDQLRSELIFRVRAVGANGAERVLITDLVVQ